LITWSDPSTTNGRLGDNNDNDAEELDHDHARIIGRLTTRRAQRNLRESARICLTRVLSRSKVRDLRAP